MHAVSKQPDRSCPDCQMPLERNGDMWQCALHGNFFSYGPRRLMRVAETEQPTAPLMPWQTVTERSQSAALPLAAVATTTK